jgi:outer membrane protein assembly factor BamB
MRSQTSRVILSALLGTAFMLAEPVTPPQASADLAEWLRQLDRNGDGQLSREEVDARPRLKTGFDRIDANHDGGISLDEMQTALARWRPSKADPEKPIAANAPPRAITASGAKVPAARTPTTLDANSPQFRGPRGDGVAYGTNLPVTWSTTSNVVWSCTIPGKGWSSPIVWGDRVFVTSSIGPGNVEAPPDKLGNVADHVRGVTTTQEHQYTLHCLDWRTGTLLWSRCAHKGVPSGPIHPKNSYASETPITDGDRVYAYFGNVGLFCYGMDGQELWSRRWGSFKMGWNWGTSASPVLSSDLLFLLNDNDEQSFLVAIDKRTGTDVWRVEREEKSNWSTPFVWQNELRTEIVTAGSRKVRSYDLTGKLLWELRGMSAVTVPTPFAADGLLYIASGCSHSPLRPVYAIHPGAASDISLQDDVTTNAHIAWSQRRAAPYVTSPLVYDGILYVLLDGGFLSAYDARTGEQVYGRQRFTTGRAAFTASPWAYDGRIFCLAETGETYVVQAGPEFRVLHVNRLDEAALATPAVARDNIILRTLTKLYRIGNTPEPATTTPQPEPMKRP